jgi:hypothetical protein
MQTFCEMYLDGVVDFNGDTLDILEYRHDWAHFGSGRYHDRSLDGSADRLGLSCEATHREQRSGKCT